MPDWTRLEGLSGALGDGSGAVDRTVDDALVEGVVRGIGDDDGALADPVDDAVDDVLVDPVQAARAIGPEIAPTTPFS